MKFAHAYVNFIDCTVLIFCTLSPVSEKADIPFRLTMTAGLFYSITPTKIKLGVSVLMGDDAASMTNSFPKFPHHCVSQITPMMRRYIPEEGTPQLHRCAHLKK